MGCRSVILDTHVLLWLITDNKSLGNKARTMCDDALASDNLGVSAISWWEIEMLRQKGRIELSQDTSSLREGLIESGLVEMTMNGDVGIRAAALDNFHGDPADRIITATAYINGLVLLTADQQILKWKNHCARQDARK